MKKFVELVKKYKIYILSGLLVIFFFRSCTKSTQARKSVDKLAEKEYVIDSLKNVINEQKITIDNFPEELRKEKIKLHSDYDNYISEKDRGQQLMDLHMIVKENLKELQ